MGIIKNADGSTGMTTSLNKYQANSGEVNNLAWLGLSSSSALPKGARLLTSIDTDKKLDLTPSHLPKNTKNIDREQVISPKVIPNNPVKHSSRKEKGNQGNEPSVFNDKITIFEFSPPSDNLWNVSIELSDVAGTTGANSKHKNLLQLFANIQAVNGTWSQNNEERWSLSGPTAKNLEAKSRFYEVIENFCDKQIGVFLAQSISFSPMSLNFDDNAFGEFLQLGGFYKNGKIVKSIKMDDTLKINFLVSNYDITDILIEPWIAAIAQHGLIENGNICLKAKITLTEYSAGYNRDEII